MLQNPSPGVRVDSVVLNCDNAPCHSKLKECEHKFPEFTIYRLGPYSPQLNPVEFVDLESRDESRDETTNVSASGATS